MQECPSTEQMCLSHEIEVLGSTRQECRIALVPIYSLSSLNQAYNYICFRAFYTGLTNIHVSNYNFDPVNEVFIQSDILTQYSPMS